VFRLKKKTLIILNYTKTEKSSKSESVLILFISTQRSLVVLEVLEGGSPGQTAENEYFIYSDISQRNKMYGQQAL
jgi:hypothetical protein